MVWCASGYIFYTGIVREVRGTTLVTICGVRTLIRLKTNALFNIRQVMSSGGARNFYLGSIAQGLETYAPSGVQGQSPGGGSEHEILQKLKWFADIVYRFWLQKRSKCEYFARFTHPFFTSLFHGGAKLHFAGGLAPKPMCSAATGYVINQDLCGKVICASLSL